MCLQNTGVTVSTKQSNGNKGFTKQKSFSEGAKPKKKKSTKPQLFISPVGDHSAKSIAAFLHLAPSEEYYEAPCYFIDKLSRRNLYSVSEDGLRSLRKSEFSVFVFEARGRYGKKQYIESINVDAKTRKAEIAKEVEA